MELQSSVSIFRVFASDEVSAAAVAVAKAAHTYATAAAVANSNTPEIYLI
jgi:hypothetical protein